MGQTEYRSGDFVGVRGLRVSSAAGIGIWGMRSQAEVAISVPGERRAQQEREKAKAAEFTAKKEEARALATANEKAKEALKQLDFARHTMHLFQLQKAANVYRKEPFKPLDYSHDYHFCPINRRCAAWRFYERQCRRWTKATHKGHTISVLSMSFSPDGKTLTSASWISDPRTDRVILGGIKLWDVKTGQEKATLRSSSLAQEPTEHNHHFRNHHFRNPSFFRPGPGLLGPPARSDS